MIILVKEISSGFNWAQAAGVLWLIAAVIGTIYKQLHPLITTKINSEKNGQVKQALQLADQLAAVIVPEMAVMAGLSKAERKKEAIRFLSDKLMANGFKISQETLSATIEKAYQEYKHVTQGDNHLPTADASKSVTPKQSAGTNTPQQSSAHGK
ncbi:putative phage holin, LL-H family [Lentilactobacillus hilgardii ATCC 27305]|nr:putative phage holin, LL-H family [Lentilactobacillus hilgardii ATCC 27305]